MRQVLKYIVTSKVIFIGIVVLLFQCLTSCGPPRDNHEDVSKTGELLQGEHMLRRFKVKTTTESRWSASYFLIAGGAGGGTFTETAVSFSFQLPDSTYAMAVLPFQKIRVKIDSTITEPYVTFRWDRSSVESISYIMSYEVQYMVVHCKEEDFPMDVQIDQL